MKIRKQDRRRTLLVAMLITVLTLGTLLGVLFTVSAASTGEYELTVNFDDTKCSLVQYEIRATATAKDTVAKGTLTDGSTISVHAYYHVTIKIVPVAGYKVTELVYDTNLKETPRASDVTDSQQYPGVQCSFIMPEKAISADVVFSNLELTVAFVDSIVGQYKFTDFDSDDIKDTEDDNVEHAGDLGGYFTKKITCRKGASIKLPEPVIVEGKAYDFQRWEVVKSDGVTVVEWTISNNELSVEVPLPDMQKAETIYLRPVFYAREYETTRKDVVFDESAGAENKYMHPNAPNWEDEIWDASMDFLYDAMANSGKTATPNIKTYPGYKLYSGTIYDGMKTTLYVKPNPELNTLYRYYSPITYTVKFNLNEGTGNFPDIHHVFNETTTISKIPTRIGFDFAGWKVTVDGVELGTVIENNKLEAETAAYAAKNKEIHLTAQWEPVAYTLNYVHGGGAFVGSYPQKHIYNEKTLIPDSVRPGYTFKGWTVTVNGEEIDTITGGSLTANCTDYATNNAERVITLTAKWKAETYDVTLNPNIGDTGDYVGGFDNPSLGQITFGDSLDGILTTVPTREGYKFLGYFTEMEDGSCFINADGHGIGTWQKDDGDDSGKVQLYAHWDPLPYNIKLVYDKNLVQSITVDGVPYNGEIIVIKYRTTIEIKVLTVDGYKVTKLNGVKDPHAANYSKIYRHEVPHDIEELKIEILPALVLPAVKVDFATETVVLADGSKLPKGKYSMLSADGEVFCDFTVAEDGAVKINGKTVRAAILAEFCYGSYVGVIQRGREGIEADSDCVEIPVPARPAAPNAEYTLSAEQDRINVTIQNDDPSKYQFSISDNPLIPGYWQDDPILTTLADGSSLSPETDYYVFIRLRYTDTTPGSVPMDPIAYRTTHAVDQISLTLPIILLTVTLLCQVAAIAFLIWRRKQVGGNRHYAIAPLPILALTARFVPAFGLPIAAVLAVLVIAAQVVLTYLLLTSDLIRRKPEEGFERDTEDENEIQEEEGASEHEPVLDSLIDADVSDENTYSENTYRFVYENEDETAQAETYNASVAYEEEYDEPVEEYADTLENDADAAQFAFDDEDELDDIDDSHLADDADDDIPDDIDDSKQV